MIYVRGKVLFVRAIEPLAQEIRQAGAVIVQLIDRNATPEFTSYVASFVSYSSRRVCTVRGLHIRASLELASLPMYPYRPLRVTFSILALALAGVHLLWPEAPIDSITLVLLIIALLPWAQPLLKSIELLGVKLEMQELQAKVADATGAAESASQQADLALSVSSSPTVTSRASSTLNEIEVLCQRYNIIREAQRSGDARTAAMTDVVRQMIEAARTSESFNVNGALDSTDRGKRLFGYVFLYARPNPSHLSALVESVTKKEDKPFGQYWGLQAIARNLNDSTIASQDVVRSLHAFASKVQPGTDRDYELRRILDHVSSR